jgi:hypothetical protein
MGEIGLKKTAGADISPLYQSVNELNTQCRRGLETAPAGGLFLLIVKSGGEVIDFDIRAHLILVVRTEDLAGKLFF